MITGIRQLRMYKNRSPLARAIFWVVLFILLVNLIFVPGFLMFSHVSFRSIEGAEVRTRSQYGRDAIQNEIDGISRITKDYAQWDDTYEFVDSHDMAYTLENFNSNGLENLTISYVAIIDTNGDIIYSKSIDFRNNEITPVSFDTASLLKKYPELLSKNDFSSVSGIISHDGKIVLLNARSILTSQYLGPSRGTLIFGRFLDAQENEKLTRITHFTLSTQSLDAQNTSDEMQLADYILTGKAERPLKSPRPEQCSLCHPITRGNPALAATNQVFVSPVSAEFLGGYTILHDLRQNPVAMMSIHIPREIEKLEQRYSPLFLLSFLGLQIILGIFGAAGIAKNIKTEETLDHEYALLRAVIDNVPEQIFAHDKYGRFLLNNLRDAQMLGEANPDDLLGKSDFDYYPPELAVKFQESEKRVVESGQALVNIEDFITRTDGSQRWILTTKSPMRNKQGQITGIVGVTHDITERKQRERELEAIVMMSRALRSAENSTELLFMIYKQIIDLLHVDFGTLEMIDRANGDAEVVYSYGFQNSLNGLRIPHDKGLNSQIHASKKPYLENNVAQNPISLNVLVDNGCTAIAGAPLIADDELIGFLWMGRKSHISEDELHLLAAMADIAASSIRRVTLHELTKKHLNHLTSLRKIDTSINSSKELDVTLGVLLEQTRDQLQAAAADVLLFSQDGGFLQFEFGQGFTTEAFNLQKILIGDGPAGLAVQRKQLIQIQNLAELGASHDLVKASQAEGFVSYFAVPLLVRTDIKGVMEVFFRKEFKPDSDWINFLETLAGQAAIAIEQVHLFTGLQHSHTELILAYDETIEGWVRALDLRDKETEGHSLRVTQMCLNLAIALGITGDDLIHVRRGALLHDIGKVGIPDHILLKPGKLTDDEWIIMRKHPQFANEMLSPINYLRPALNIPYYHHEKWDGSGYPCGLKAEEIPLAARIFSVVDVWDALSNDRPYRKAWSKEAVLQYLKEQAGIQFDRRVVDIFLQII